MSTVKHHSMFECLGQQTLQMGNVAIGYEKKESCFPDGSFKHDSFLIWHIDI